MKIKQLLLTLLAFILVSGPVHADMVLVYLGTDTIIDNDIDALVGDDAYFLDKVDWDNTEPLIDPQTSGGLTIDGTVFKPEPDTTEAIAGTWTWDPSYGDLSYLSIKFDGWTAIYEITDGMTEGTWSTLDLCENGGAGVAAGEACNMSGGAFALSNSAAYAVPVPAAAWLFGSGLLGLAGIARRKRV